MTTSIRNNQLNLLARRSGYNLALRQFRTTKDFVADVGDGFNLADIINEALQADEIDEFQIRPILNIILQEKYDYVVKTQNLTHEIKDVEALQEVVERWENIQFVLMFLDRNSDIHIVNPVVAKDWEASLPLAVDELLVCYAGALKDVGRDVLESAAEDFFSLLYGQRPRDKSGYKYQGGLRKRALEHFALPEGHDLEEDLDEQEGSADQAVVPVAVGPRKISAKVAVNVTNELFHNGNVESWKRIIESYKVSHPGTDVLVWYEGERINDLNALFKWGKVKHGVPIMFSITVADGENIANISKLKKYLFEGASSRFEAFLHGAPGSVLQLF